MSDGRANAPVLDAYDADGTFNKDGEKRAV